MKIDFSGLAASAPLRGNTDALCNEISSGQKFELPIAADVIFLLFVF